MAENFGGMSVYVASGNGVPCDPQDVQEIAQRHSPLNLFEPFIFVYSKGFDRALTNAHVPHTADFYGCGIHSYRYWQRDLHRFWPQMLNAFGTSPPATFNYRTADPAFTVWGWSFAADARRAAEFLDIHNASRRGITLTGSGTDSVATAPYFAPGQTVLLTGAGGPPKSLTADSSGRITFTVDLGAPHALQQYTVLERIAELQPGYFKTRTVVFIPSD
jgi:hypothetical protein